MRAAPTWPQLVLLVRAAAPPTARGRYRWIEPADEDRPAVQMEGAFAFAPPNRWRVEDGGRLLRVCDGTRVVAFDADGTAAAWPAGNYAGDGPELLFGPGRRLSFTDRDDYSGARTSPVAVQLAGRAAWRVWLEPPPAKEGGLELVVDDETGVMLRMSNEMGGSAEILEVTFGVETPDYLFRYDGPLDRDDLAERERHHAVAQQWDGRDLPTLTWWPGGLLANVSRAEEDGTVLLSLHVPPGSVDLGRAPLGTLAPVTDPPGADVVRVDALGWSWALTTADRAPLPADVARQIIESVG